MKWINTQSKKNAVRKSNYTIFLYRSEIIWNGSIPVQQIHVKLVILTNLTVSLAQLTGELKLLSNFSIFLQSLSVPSNFLLENTHPTFFISFPQIHIELDRFNINFYRKFVEKNTFTFLSWNWIKILDLLPNF